MCLPDCSGDRVEEGQHVEHAQSASNDLLELIGTIRLAVTCERDENDKTESSLPQPETGRIYLTNCQKASVGWRTSTGHNG